MGKIFTKINEMVPYWEPGSTLSETLLLDVKKKILGKMQEGKFQYFDTVLGVRLYNLTEKIYISGDNCNAYFTITNNEVSFLACYFDSSEVEIPYSPVTMCFVWRNKNLIDTKNILIYVLLNRWFNIHHALLSDITYTDDGKGMFFAMIQQAYHSGYEVYFLDTMNETVFDGSELELDDLLREATSYFGSSEEYKYKLIAVCDPKYKEE